MTLRDYLRVIREHWLLVVLGPIVGLAVAGVITATTPAQYSSSTVLYVANPAAPGNTTAQYQGNLLSQQLVKSYTEMITSPRVTVPAQQQVAAGGTSPNGQVKATAQPDTVLITVNVTDSDPARAAAMANAVGNVFSQTVAGLERPQVPGQPPGASIQTFAPAVPSSAPTSPKAGLNLALGGVLGLVLGLGLAFGRSILDTRVRSAQNVETVTDATSVGAVADGPHSKGSALVVEDEPNSQRAEAFRQLRTNLQFVDIDRERKVMLVTSSVPGEGKSFTATNLALAFAAAGHSVVLVDADLRRPRLDQYLGLERGVGLTTVLSGRARLDDALQSWRGRNLHVLTAGDLPPNPSELLGSANMGELLADLSQRFSIVLLDTPPLLPVTDAAALGQHCDGALLVVQHGQTRKPQLQQAVSALDSASVRLLGTILNRVPASGPQAYTQYAYTYRSERDRASTDEPQLAEAASGDAPGTAVTRPLRAATGHHRRPRRPIEPVPGRYPDSDEIPAARSPRTPPRPTPAPRVSEYESRTSSGGR